MTNRVERTTLMTSAQEWVLADSIRRNLSAAVMLVCAGGNLYRHGANNPANNPPNSPNTAMAAGTMTALSDARQ